MKEFKSLKIKLSALLYFDNAKTSKKTWKENKN